VPKLVYDFVEGNKDMKDLLGGKGANLAEMTNLGLPVPPGFIISTDACRYYLEHGTVPEGLAAEVTDHLKRLEAEMGRDLGAADDPLLVSVRSGAKFSMPGMMETVLNIGLSDASVDGLAKKAGSDRFAWDSYRRLIQMFGKTVLDIEGEKFEHALDAAKTAKGTKNDLDLDAGDLKGIVATFKQIVKDETAGDRTPDAETTGRFFTETKKRGLLIGRGGLHNNVLRIAPALNCGKSDIEEALRIKEKQGGVCVVADGKVRAFVPLPIAGLLSDKRITEVAEEVKVLKAEWAEAGCTIPYMGFNLIPLSVIPEIRITDKGLVLVPQMELAPLFE